jgi:hypothetical protein
VVSKFLSKLKKAVCGATAEAKMLAQLAAALLYGYEEELAGFVLEVGWLWEAEACDVVCSWDYFLDGGFKLHG